MANDAVTRMLHVLDQERQALRSGRIEELAELALAKETLAAELAQMTPDPQQIEQMRRAAQRNLRLLSAATKGVRAARDRLGMAGTSSFRTYDRRGRTRLLQGAAPHVMRRA